MISLAARLAAIERRRGRAPGPPSAQLVIYHPGRPDPSCERGGTVISLPCNGRVPCAICAEEAGR